jgi:hypothetical protein
LREPHEREGQHAQQEAGADPAGGRLGGEAPVAARVEHEHGDDDDLAEQPVDGEEALEAGRVRKLLRGEPVVGVELRQFEGARDGGPPEARCCPDPDRGGQQQRGEARRALQAGGPA